MILDALLTKDEQQLRREVRDYIKNEVSHDLVRAMDRDEITFPRSFVEKLGEKNLLGLRFPKHLGGRDMKWTAEIAAEEEIGVLGAALGCNYAMYSIVGEALNCFGTPLQKEKYLKPMLQGKLVSAEGLTEPRGGSDFFGATTKAELKGDYFLLNGMKRFVVGAVDADIIAVYCVTNPTGKPKEKLSMLLVERDENVKVEYKYGLLGCRGGGTGRVVFRNVKVPKENIIGEMNQGSVIFDQMMIPERLTSAAASLGMARAALETATKYTNKREAFGRKIREFQSVSNMIADSITRLDAARSLVYSAAKVVDLKMPHRRVVSEAKKFATQTAWDIINNAMQAMGGIAYTSVYPVEKLLRDSRLGIIWTGSNEIMDQLIQHEYYKEFLKDPEIVRNYENDAQGFDDNNEKCFNNDDMWKDF